MGKKDEKEKTIEDIKDQNSAEIQSEEDGIQTARTEDFDDKVSGREISDVSEKMTAF
jgi:hypothetical protein